MKNCDLCNPENIEMYRAINPATMVLCDKCKQEIDEAVAMWQNGYEDNMDTIVQRMITDGVITINV